MSLVKRLIGVLMIPASFFVAWYFFNITLEVIASLKDNVSLELRWALFIASGIFSLFLLFFIIEKGLNMIESTIKNKQLYLNIKNDGSWVELSELDIPMKSYDAKLEATGKL